MARLWSDTDEDTEAEMIRLLRESPGWKRLALASSLSSTVIELSRDALRRAHPGLSESEIRLRWIGAHYGAVLERELREYLGIGD
jgi:hypothetical protein